MKNIIQITLGVMASLGGFVDIGELVFAAQAGAKEVYSLLWVIIVGTVGISLYGEMCGRVAAVAKQPVFSIVRKRLGLWVGLITLVASSIVNLITCAAEIAGAAIVLQLLFGYSFRAMAVAAAASLIMVVWMLPFKWLERLFGFLGLFMLTFCAAVIVSKAPAGEVLSGFVPGLSSAGSASSGLIHTYFIIGLLSSMVMPYEVYFYSSGGIEEGWGPKDLTSNRITAILGFTFGSLVTAAILINAAHLFVPLKLEPELLGTTALQTAVPLGMLGLITGLIGMLFAVTGASTETCLAGSYAICQFFGVEWGRYRGHLETPSFTLIWNGIFLLSLGIVLIGIDPLDLVEYAVVFSIVILPLTYAPILSLASDSHYMGDHVNGPVSKVVGSIYLLIITITAVAAIPIFLATRGQV